MESWNATISDSSHSGFPTGNHTPYVFRVGPLVSINYPLPLFIVVALILVLVVVVPAFANLLVGIALFRYRSLRTTSNVLIGNLAFSDFMLAVAVLPMSVCHECLGHWVFGRELCNTWLVCDALCCTASLWNICAVAFDRFTATFYPIWYRDRRSSRRAAVGYVSFVWAVSSAVCLPPVLGWIDLRQNYRYDEYLGVYRCHLINTMSYVIYSAFGSFYVPFAITFLLYGLILAAIRRRSGNFEKFGIRAEGGGYARQTSTAFRCLPRQNSVRPRQTADEESSPTTAPLERFSSVDGHKPGIIIDPDLKLPCGPCLSLGLHRPLGTDNPNSDAAVTTTDPSGGGESGLRDGWNSSTSCSGHHSTDSLAPDAQPVTPRSILAQENATEILETVDSSERARKPTPVRSGTHRRRHDTMETRATVRMAIIVLFFCGMWTGFSTVYVVHACCKTCRVPAAVEAFFFWLGYANSSINPVLYAVLNEEFRKAFVKILRCHGTNRR